MGSLSECLPNGGFFQTVEKTNKLCFMSYMRDLREQILPEYRDKKLVLLLDNHR